VFFCPDQMLFSSFDDLNLSLLRLSLAQLPADPAPFLKLSSPPPTLHSFPKPQKLPSNPFRICLGPFPGKPRPAMALPSADISELLGPVHRSHGPFSTPAFAPVVYRCPIFFGSLGSTWLFRFGGVNDSFCESVVSGHLSSLFFGQPV